MLRIKWITSLGAAALFAAMANLSTPLLVAKERAGIRPTFNYGNQKWKHVPKQVKARQGGGIRFSNPFKGRSMPKMRMPNMPKLSMPKFASQQPASPKVIVDPNNRAYLGKTGPVNLQFSGYQSGEFDRNNIKYVELQGEFPMPPAKPRATEHVIAPPEPKPVPPPPGNGVGETIVPVQVDTQPQNLMGILGGTPKPRKATVGSVVLDKRVDQQSTNSQEIYTPFVIPYDARPPAISVKGKATYIRE